MMTMIFIAVSVVVVAALLIPILVAKKQIPLLSRRQINVKSASTRLAELQLARDNNEITTQRFEEYQRELEDSVSEDLNTIDQIDASSRRGNIALALLIALVVPVVSVITYDYIGGRDLLVQSQQPVPFTASEQATELEKAIAAVEKSVSENPNDVEGRIALAQVYFETERYSDAATVYRALYHLRPNEPDILVNFAEALARSHGNRLTGRPTELIDEALQHAPNHGRALWLAGYAGVQAGNTGKARKHWEHLLTGLQNDSEMYQKVEALIADLHADSGMTTVAQTESVAYDDASGASVQVNVKISPELAARINPSTTVFIFARASEGPPMPLAVHKGIAGNLPITVTLDDSMAMVPQMKLSSFPKIVVAARLSSNGQPQGQIGDYEGFSAPIEIAITPVVEVIIDSIKQ